MLPPFDIPHGVTKVLVVNPFHFPQTPLNSSRVAQRFHHLHGTRHPLPLPRGEDWPPPHTTYAGLSTSLTAIILRRPIRLATRLDLPLPLPPSPATTLAVVRKW